MLQVVIWQFNRQFCLILSASRTLHLLRPTCCCSWVVVPSSVFHWQVIHSFFRFISYSLLIRSADSLSAVTIGWHPCHCCYDVWQCRLTETWSWIYFERLVCWPVVWNNNVAQSYWILSDISICLLYVCMFGLGTGWTCKPFPVHQPFLQTLFYKVSCFLPVYPPSPFFLMDICSEARWA